MEVIKMKLFNHNETNEFCIEYYVEMISNSEVINDTTITINLDNDDLLDLHEVLESIWNNVNSDGYYDEIMVTSYHYFKEIHQMYKTTWTYSRFQRGAFARENMKLIRSGYDN